MDIDALKDAAINIVAVILEDEEWDDATGQLFLMLAEKAADASETEFYDEDAADLALKLHLNQQEEICEWD